MPQIPSKNFCLILLCLQWRILHFPNGWGIRPERWGNNLVIWPVFSSKLHENARNWTERETWIQQRFGSRCYWICTKFNKSPHKPVDPVLKVGGTLRTNFRIITLNLMNEQEYLYFVIDFRQRFVNCLVNLKKIISE